MSDEIARLSADLGHVAFDVAKRVQKAVEVAARNTKDEAQKNAKETSGRHAKGYPHTIDYEMHFGLTQTRAEVGPDISRYGGQAALGILEDSPGRARNAPKRNLERAAKSTFDDFARHVLDAAGDFL